jgi:hypothetical protein
MSDFSFLILASVDGKRLYFMKIQVEIKGITAKTGHC